MQADSSSTRPERTDMEKLEKELDVPYEKSFENHRHFISVGNAGFPSRPSSDGAHSRWEFRRDGMMIGMGHYVRP